MNRAVALRYLFVAALFFSPYALSAGPLVLFDNCHAENSGNAEWTIDGAYSDLASMLTNNGFSVGQHCDGPLSAGILRKVDIVVLPEPNSPFSREETRALVQFVSDGGGLLMIADHDGSDRNRDGWDSIDVLNRIGARLGILFHHKWINQIPLGGERVEGPLVFRVSRMACWGGTSAFRMKAPLMSPGGLRVAPGARGPRLNADYFLCGCVYGKGRVVALGDSSPFDDGTGSPDKKLHDSFNSFMFDIPQMAFNIFNWLAGQRVKILHRSVNLDLVSNGGLAGVASCVLIDAAHFNLSADKMKRFARRASSSATVSSKNGGDSFNRGGTTRVVYCDLPFDRQILLRAAVVFIDNPSKAYSSDELQALRNFVLSGGRLVVSGRGGGRRGGGRAGLLNELLEAVGVRARLRDDQVHDDTSNYGRPWSLVLENFTDHYVTRGVRHLLFWNSCSIDTTGVPPGRFRTIAFAGPRARRFERGAYVNRPPGEKLPLIVEEKVGRGRVIIQGTCCFTDYQYTEERRAEGVRDAVGVDKHETPLYNQRLVNYMLGKTGSREH